MSDSRTNKNGLAERLRREAEQSRPDFSPELHARLCQAIAAERPAAVARRPRPWRAVMAAAVVAASAAAALWLVREKPADSIDRPTEVAQVVPPAPTVPDEGASRVASLARDVPAEIPRMVDSAIEAPRWAWLDHDARLTVELVAAPLPTDLAGAGSN